MISPSLLYLPNEGRAGDQVGPRAAFSRLLQAGHLAAYSVFSFLVEAREHGRGIAMAALIQRVRAMQPDVLLWQHVAGFPVSASDIAQLRGAAPRMRLVYHEGDIYGRFIKRLPGSTRRLMAAADTVALVGRGEFAQLARSAGARRVVYSPHSVDSIRFGQEWTPTLTRAFDVVMIGNQVKSRVPFFRLPGANSRVEMVRVLGQRFGARFAVFGKGWDGFSGNQGPLPFDEQESTQRQAWVTVSWDHFDGVEAYFSDRVPISLISGVPHVTNYQPGYEEVFSADPPLRWALTVPGMVAEVEQLLACGAVRLNEIGARAQCFARENLSADVVYARLIQQALQGSE